MIAMLVLAGLAIAPGTQGEEAGPFAVTITLSGQCLEPGATGEVGIELALDGRWRVPRNPLLPDAAPAAMLEILAPAEVELTGDSAETLPELLATAFLDLPYQRMLDPGASSVPFRMLREPGQETAFELSVLIYATPPGGERPRLVRRRYRLPLRAGARAEAVEPTSSAWGKKDVLRIGDVAPAFELPTPFGAPLALADVLGHGPVVLTTYRSCL